MNAAEFDAVADEYHEQHCSNIEITGEMPEYFAEYKLKVVRQLTRQKTTNVDHILDFGSGIGNSIPHFNEFVPGAHLTCADVSQRSLDIADSWFPGLGHNVRIEGAQLPFGREAFDLTFSACVFHRIPHEEHVHWLGELRRVTRPGGIVAVFKHNPLNPLTVRAVNTCPFDANAKLIRAKSFAKACQEAGWRRPSVRYHLFFPRALAALRALEPHLSHLAIGAQYSIAATKSLLSVSRAERTRLRIGLDGGNAVANPSPTLTIVVPCYNEDEVLPETARRLDMLIVELINDNCIAVDSHACFVDDGSTDRTWAIIRALRESSARFGGIRLSRNRGHQIALMARLLAAPGDIMISVDADLQDDLNAIRKMLDVAAAGADIVYGVRSARTTDTMIKRLTAHLYYHLLRLLSVEIIFDHADFRLMTRRAVDALRHYEEPNLFLRALVPLLGFKSSTVLYERTERWAGTSKYPIGKMLGLALEGITSFSTRPLRLVTILGFGISCLAFIIAAWAIFATIVMKATIPGWASTVIPIYLICGVQLLCVGVIGEYFGKIYLETKRRPRSDVLERLELRSPSSCGSPTARASHGETTPIFAQVK